MNRITNLLAVGLGAVGLVSAVGGGIVLAQDGGSGTATPSARAVEHQERMTAYLDALASNLGIDRATLDAALKKTGLEMVDKAVADGKITQAEADAIKARIESGIGPVFGPFGGGMKGGHGPGERGMGGFDFGAGLSGLAGFLGIDQATLMQELASAKSLLAVAEAHGKTRADLETFLTETINAEIQKAQDAGKMTAEQAQMARDKVAEMIGGILDGGMGGHFEFKGPGGSHFRGGFGGPKKPGAGAPASGQAE